MLELVQEGFYGTYRWADLDVESDEGSLVIQAGPIGVHLRGTGGGIVVDLFSTNDPQCETLASTWLMYTEAREEG